MLSADKGNMVIPLSRDHKPTDEVEKERVIEAGG
jgi:hypothetical protein